MFLQHKKAFKKQEWGFLKHPTYPWGDLFSAEQKPNGSQRELFGLGSAAQQVVSELWGNFWCLPLSWIHLNEST
jgi:hypothetical protein